MGKGVSCVDVVPCCVPDARGGDRESTLTVLNEEAVVHYRLIVGLCAAAMPFLQKRVF